MFNFIGDGFSMFEKDLFPVALMAGVEIGTFPWEGYFMDMGTPESFLQLNRDVVTGNAPTRRPLAEPTTAPVIHESARIDGSINYGDGVSVSANSRVIGPVVLGDGVVIGDSALVEDSVVLAGASYWRECHRSRRYRGARRRSCRMARKSAREPCTTASTKPPPQALNVRRQWRGLK